jgi:hypothetical protein
VICLPQQLAQVRLAQLPAFAQCPQQQQQALIHCSAANTTIFTYLPTCRTESSLEN